MSDKFRLNNKKEFDVGIICPSYPNGFNVRRGTFAMATQDDIDYLMSSSSVLQRGFLQIADPVKKTEVIEMMGMEEHEAPQFMSEEEIKKKLNGTGKKIEEWLKEINDPVTLDNIAGIAKSMNLSANKIKILSEKMPEYDFIG